MTIEPYLIKKSEPFILAYKKELKNSYRLVTFKDGIDDGNDEYKERYCMECAKKKIEGLVSLYRENPVFEPEYNYSWWAVLLNNELYDNEDVVNECHICSTKLLFDYPKEYSKYLLFCIDNSANHEKMLYIASYLFYLDMPDEDCSDFSEAVKAILEKINTKK